MLPLHLLAHSVENKDCKDERNDVVADERREEDAIDCDCGRITTTQPRRQAVQPPIAIVDSKSITARTFEVEDGEVGDVGQRYVERQEDAQHPHDHQRVQQVPRDELRTDFNRPKQ